MKVLIGSDHAGFALKEQLKKEFSNEFSFEDVGTFSEESVDYPDFAHKLTCQISQNPSSFGILICGTGNGMAMCANKYKDVRAGLCWNADIAALVRQHNNANILVIPARFITLEEAKNVFKTFFSTDFEGGRHQRRVEKVNIQ